MIRHWSKPGPDAIGNNIREFVERMGGPCRIEIPGRDPTRCRVLVTLLHGNETSGLKALFALLRDSLPRGWQPAVTTYCYVIAHEACLLEPSFTHRQVPGKRDYNRCFKPPWDDDEQGLVCKQLLDEIRELQPEAVVDMHNTSGEGPAFAVTCRLTPRHDPIVSLFTERLIVTDLVLGALMETDSDKIPVITIECGGAFEDTADRFAWEGLHRYFSAEDIHKPVDADWSLDIYQNPRRMELQPGLRLAYADNPRLGADITLKVDIEHHNFGQVDQDTFLGWVSPTAEHKLAVYDSDHNNHFRDFYRVSNGRLFPRCPQRLFMITSNPIIASSDCLWYTVADQH